jgi:hypothetical protein
MKVLKYLSYVAIVLDAALLATFFYPPTLEIYMHWADAVVRYGK